MSAGSSFLSLLTTIALAFGCTSPDPSAPPADPAPPADEPGLQFVDVVHEVGLDAFRQVSGDADKMYLPASTGAGVALFDFDGDGDLDVFLVNGSRIGGFEPGNEPTNRLFENQGGGASFLDVTRAQGLASHGAWGQGCSVADVDGDGTLDVYVTNYGPNALYLNRGPGEGFVEVAGQAGVDTPSWSTGAAFFDYDRDGDLDLYVANFVRFDEVLAAHEGRELPTHEWKGLRVAIGPQGLPAAGDRLFRNDGPDEGLPVSFADVTDLMGISSADASYGFQPSPGDVDGDGFLDLFVPNDSRPNFLWRNHGGRGFEETALVAGVAVDRAGNNQACMGVTFDDYDGDDRLDLFVTNFADDFNTLYAGGASGFFQDRTAAAGLWTPETQHRLAWGTFFFDADHDGKAELFVANGHIYPQIDQLGIAETYAQANQLFVLGGDGRFEDVSTAAGPGFAISKVSRGAAMGDLDDDGDLDIVINNLDDVPTVLRNDSRATGRWLKVLLRGRGHNTSAIGARVRVEAGGKTYSRYVRSAESFLSHHDLRLHFGLGSAEKVDRLTIDWPDGTTEALAERSPTSVLLVIQQGEGVVSSNGLR